MTLKMLLRILATPSCWLRNHHYSDEWDRRINDALDGGAVISEVGELTANINGERIWIANHPYASCTPRPGLQVMPSRATVFRLMDAIHGAGLPTLKKR